MRLVKDKTHDIAGEGRYDGKRTVRGKVVQTTSLASKIASTAWIMLKGDCRTSFRGRNGQQAGGRSS